MAFLLLYVSESCPFRQADATHAIQTLHGASLQRPDDNCILTYQYSYGGDVTLISLKTNLRTIKIDGMGDASLFAALHIQSKYPHDIHMIDEAYAFDIVLRGIASLNELKRRIHDAGA